MLVASRTLSNLVDGTPMIVQPAATLAYFWYKLWRDSDLALTVLSPVCSVISAVITLNLAVGKVTPFIYLNDAQMVLSLVAAAVFALLATVAGAKLAITKAL